MLITRSKRRKKNYASRPPPKTLGYQGLFLFSSCPFQDEYAYIRVPNLVPIGPARCLAYFPYGCMCDRLTHSKYLLGLERLILFSRYPFTDDSAYVCQIWSRSVQWFVTEPSVTAKVSSVFSPCWRGLVQKHAKKQQLYIENYNSGPNILTTTSLRFFTAIFLAFHGSLAEVLIVMCRHVTTELYTDEVFNCKI